MFVTVNKKLAVAPFEVRDVKTKRVGGVALMEHLVQLEKTVIVFPNTMGIPPGTEIFVSGDSVKHKWASEVFEHEGQKFVVMPEDYVIAYISPPLPSVVPMDGPNG